MPPAPPSSRLRLFGLLAVVVLTAALPLAGASAGPVHDGAKDPVPKKAVSADSADSAGSADSGGSADSADSAKDRSGGAVAGARTRSGDSSGSGDRGRGAPGSLLTGLGLTAAARCGPELSSPEGVEAQTCVLTQGRDTWARTYYRNAMGERLDVVLTLMAPEGRTVRIDCPVGAGDDPGMCQTPRDRTEGSPGDYSAVAEYASGADGPLLLRAGSNSAPLKEG
ncbi:hypothetical protein [Streptomyces beihaiensis]|uniref:Secreted protein n=1 Tax=Streptomyces beihaiensis TaxID=2984495 RepID=A0ABT3TSX4_9ACTN|nr:hypothetical protein [Streptomyces beihaiensis]MCX3059185.1 hypothetical protein [Streptomyces beihaiensis]